MATQHWNTMAQKMLKQKKVKKKKKEVKTKKQL